MKQPNIQVKDAVIENNANFHTYTIAGSDQKGDFYTRRRFSDFLKLRSAMLVEWPGCYIPSLPDKKLIGYKEPKFVEHRKRFLQYFCQKMAGISHLYWSQHFQLMLRHPAHDIDNALEGIKQKPTMFIVRRYRELFGNELHKTPLIDLKKGITHFQEYLKKAEKTLKALEVEAQQLEQSKRVYEQCLTNCHIVLLPGYEQDVLVGHIAPAPPTGELLPLTNSPDVVNAVRSHQAVATDNNSFEFLTDMLQLELRELEVMAGLVKSLHTAEDNLSKFQKMRQDCQAQLSKLMSGKSTLRSVFTLVPKETQIKNLQTNVESLKYEIEATQALIEYIILIVGGIEIHQWKATKRMEYYENMRRISKQQLKGTVLYGSVLRTMMVALEPLQKHLDRSTLQLQAVLQRRPSSQSSPTKNSQDEVQSCHMQPQPSEF